MPPAARLDPYQNFRFLVEIDGITAAGFHSVDGIESIISVIDYREGNEVGTSRKLPGLRTSPNLVLRRGLSQELDLWNWHQTVIDGNTDRRNGRIVILNEKRVEVLSIQFRNAWPCRWSIFWLDAQGNDTLFEEVELAIEDLRVQT